MHSSKRGFTLIELLVVIAIIGILATVVLASLNSARDKGEDAAVKANLKNAQPQAEIYYDTNGDYDLVCDPGTDTIDEMVTAAGGTCNDTGGAAWAAEAQLSDGSTYFCVDSTGFAGERTSSMGTATACPSS